MIAPERRIGKGFASQGGKLDVEESDVALKRSLSRQDSQRAGVKLVNLIPRSDIKVSIEFDMTFSELSRYKTTNKVVFFPLLF